MENELTLLDNLNLIKKLYVIYLVNQKVSSQLNSEEKYLKRCIDEWTREAKKGVNEKEIEDSNRTIELIKQQCFKSIEEYRNNALTKRKEIEGKISLITNKHTRFINDLNNKQKRLGIVIPIIVAVVMFICVLIPIVITMVLFKDAWATMIPGLIFALGLLFGATFGSYKIVRGIFNRKNGQDKQTLNRELESLKEELKEYSDESIEKHVAKIQAIYDESIKKEKEKQSNNNKETKYKKSKLIEYNKRLPILSISVDKFNKNVSIAKKTLETVLANSPLHSKYYSFGYVSQIYEYLDTGRCSELEGPYGCYNLLEHEIQMKIIIEQLTRINISLDEIKSNQQVIIQQLKSIRSNIDRIFTELKTIRNEIERTNNKLDSFESYVESSNANLKNIKNNIKLITACASFNTSSNVPIAYRATMLYHNLLNKA